MEGNKNDSIWLAIVTCFMIALGAAVVTWPYRVGTLFEDGSHSILGCIMPWMGCTPEIATTLVTLALVTYFASMFGILAYAAYEIRSRRK